MKITLVLLAFLVAAPSAALAQRLDIDHLDRLAERADEAINVTITPDMLRVFSGFIPSNDANALAAKQFVSGLKGIYVRTFEFSRDNAYSPDDVNTIRKQLTNPRWAKMVTVDSKRDREMVDVYFWMDNDKIGGLAVLVAEATRLTVVNIVGPIDPSKLTMLKGNYGIPDIPEIDAAAGAKKP